MMARIIKLLSIVLVITGIVIMFLDKRMGAELPLLIGLFMGFVSRGTMEDERSLYLKSSSAYIALVLGYGLKLVTTNLYEHQIISFQLYEINHFLILVFAIATILYYTRLYLSVD